MEFDGMQPSNDHLIDNDNNGCECGCNCCDPRSCSSGTWMRSVKRKLDELETEREKFVVSGILIPQVAHVNIHNECGALREMVTNQQQNIHNLSIELEEERKASSSAAKEAMSMILRLQRVKAEVEMEARQFKRFSEEKTAHDQQEIAALEDLLYKREQTIQALTCEVQAYKYRMMSYGLTESEIDVATRSNSIAESSENQLDYLPYEYPPLKCHSNEQQHHVNYPESSDNETVDIDKFAFEETPRSLKDIEQRINQLEKSPKHSQPVLDKLIIGHSPKKPKSSRFSMDSTSSFFATIKEDSVPESPRFGGNMRKMDSQDYSSFKKVDNGSEFGDEMSDRIYTVDSIHYEESYNNNNANNNPKGNHLKIYNDEFMSTPMDQDEDKDPEVMKLYARLHALEADRESMRQAIINMRTDKAQLVLLKEIAQHLYKEVSPTSRMPNKNRSVIGNFFVFSLFEWMPSVVYWRRRAYESRYMFGMTSRNPGMMVLLDKGPQVGQWRCLSRTQL